MTTPTPAQVQMDADMEAVLNEQQSINPFFLGMDGEQIPAIRTVTPETQAMMDAGFLPEKSFDAMVRQADIIAYDISQPQIKDEVLVADDFNPGKTQPYTIRSAKADTYAVEWTYTLVIKV